MGSLWRAEEPGGMPYTHLLQIKLKSRVVGDAVPRSSYVNKGLFLQDLRVFPEISSQLSALSGHCLAKGPTFLHR